MTAKKPAKTAKAPTLDVSGLTPKQQRFVDEYLVDLNATQAAIRAGYSAKTAGSIANETLTKPEIAAAIQQAMQDRSDRTQITADAVLQELGRIGFSDMRVFATWGANGVTLNESASLKDDSARCVAEVSETRTKDGGAIRFKLHDKVAALEKIAKHLGMFGEKASEDFSDLSKLSDDELEQMRRKLRLVS